MFGYKKSMVADFVEEKMMSPHQLEAYELLKSVCKSYFSIPADPYFTEVTEKDREALVEGKGINQFKKDFECLSPIEQLNKFRQIFQDESLIQENGLVVALSLLSSTEVAILGTKLRKQAINERSTVAVEAINRLCELHDDKEIRQLVRSIPLKDIVWEPYSKNVCEQFLKDLVDHKNSRQGEKVLDVLAQLPPKYELEQGNLNLSSKLEMLIKEGIKVRKAYEKELEHFPSSVLILEVLPFWTGEKNYLNDSKMDRNNFFSAELTSSFYEKSSSANPYAISVAEQVLKNAVEEAIETRNPEYFERILNTSPTMRKVFEQDEVFKMNLERWAAENKEELSKRHALNGHDPIQKPMPKSAWNP